MNINSYNKFKAITYAKKWALKRNNEYYNFDSLGGDCTNFVSQCLYAGCNVMNHTNVTGWYYNNLNDRTASWTGVEFLYNFLITNQSIGPFARLVEENQIEIGDVIELGRFSGEFYHSVIVSDVYLGNIYVCAHTFDALDRPLNSYTFEKIRYIKILGFRST